MFVVAVILLTRMVTHTVVSDHLDVDKPLLFLHKSYYKSRCCKDYKFLLHRVGTQESHLYKMHIFASLVTNLLVVAQQTVL